MSMNKEEVEKVLNAELMKIEKGATFNGKWQHNFKVSKEYTFGMPWKSEEDKKRNPSSSQQMMAYIIQVSNKDASKMDGLLREAKEQKVWQKYWGNTAFMVNLPEYDASPETKKKYIQMVNVHAAIQLSIGHATLPKILDLDTQFSLP